MHQEVIAPTPAPAPREGFCPETIKRDKLRLYFSSIGFDPGFELPSEISEESAQFIGEQLWRLSHLETVPDTLFEAVAEKLFFRSETRKLSLARMYALVSLALGYPGWAEAREACNRNGKQIPVKATSRLPLEAFGPSERKPPPRLHAV